MRVEDASSKKIRETDAIFEQVRAAHERAANDPTRLRISIDTKAKVKIGEFSRGGRGRGDEAVRAVDHDLHPDAVLAPAGILEVVSGQLTIVFGTSRDTADFVADALEHWWCERKAVHPGIRRLQIDLDNGPEIASSRTQFLKRLVEFAQREHLEIELVYYPPYHSKYNPIEHCWGILENHWNGTLLTTIRTALAWAATMTWRGLRPFVHLLEKTYERGVTLTKTALQQYAPHIQRSDTLPKWSVTIRPH